MKMCDATCVVIYIVIMCLIAIICYIYTLILEKIKRRRKIRVRENKIECMSDDLKNKIEEFFVLDKGYFVEYKNNIYFVCSDYIFSRIYDVNKKLIKENECICDEDIFTAIQNYKKKKFVG